jgi:predicted  nucleic acid-binding Zn-ribbon protein
MSNKDRNRYNELEKEIGKLEAKVVTIKTEMTSAGYAALAELATKLKTAETKLETLVNEWADLESKL